MIRIELIFLRNLGFWLKFNSGGKYLIEAKRTSSYKIRSVLTIRDTQPSDYGFYKCVSENILGFTESSAQIYGESSIIWEEAIRSFCLRKKQLSLPHAAIYSIRKQLASLMAPIWAICI